MFNLDERDLLHPSGRYDGPRITGMGAAGVAEGGGVDVQASMSEIRRRHAMDSAKTNAMPGLAGCSRMSARDMLYNEANELRRRAMQLEAIAEVLPLQLNSLSPLADEALWELITRARAR